MAATDLGDVDDDEDSWDVSVVMAGSAGLE
jgi:hypothetical protein